MCYTPGVSHWHNHCSLPTLLSSELTDLILLRFKARITVMVTSGTEPLLQVFHRTHKARGFDKHMDEEVTNCRLISNLRDTKVINVNSNFYAMNNYILWLYESTVDEPTHWMTNFLIKQLCIRIQIRYVCSRFAYGTRKYNRVTLLLVQTDWLDMYTQSFPQESLRIYASFAMYVNIANKSPWWIAFQHVWQQLILSYLSYIPISWSILLLSRILP